MHPADWFVLVFYLAGTALVGVWLGRLIKDSSDMFGAGGRSPWWASGLSAFMTMFSANTFVVWGSIAFETGLVAIIINLMIGVAATAVGFFVAGRWKALGVATAAEYVRLRFGPGALHFYTWSMMVLRMVGTGAALYALGKILVALMPLPEGNPFRDPETGNLSLSWAIMIFGGIVVLYTMVGGLWAVLMTDVLQFIILNLAVLVVVPLALGRVGGLGGFLEAAPAGFFQVVSEEKYTFFFLCGWAVIHFFMIGAEWAFVQRFLCVPTRRDARRSTWLFGGLYLISPFLWLLPPMIYRVVDPSADPEQAYILSCRAVLPIGMVGLMMAAMFSATASMVSSQLNVFSGVLTHDIYQPISKKSDEAALLRAGRIFTILLGGLIIFIALEIEKYGRVKDLIISITELIVVPLLAPSLWGIFSRRISGRALWATGLTGFSLGLLARFGLQPDGWFGGVAVLGGVVAWVDANAGSLNTVIGAFLPIGMLAVFEWQAKQEDPGWTRLEKLRAERAAEAEAHPVGANPVAAKVVAWCLAVCGLLVLALIPVNSGNLGILCAFGFGLLGLATFILLATRRAAAPITQRLP